MCEILLKHLLLGIVILLKNIGVVIGLLTEGLFVSLVHFAEVVHSTIILQLKSVCHAWRDVLAAGDGSGHVVVLWLEVVLRSLVEANDLGTVADAVIRWCLVDRLISLVDRDELILDELIVWLILVFELVDIVENVLDLVNVLRLVPKHLLWVLEALGLDFLNLLHGVLLDFSPDQLLLQEVQDDKV